MGNNKVLQSNKEIFVQRALANPRINAGRAQLENKKTDTSLKRLPELFCKSAFFQVRY